LAYENARTRSIERERRGMMKPKKVRIRPAKKTDIFAILQLIGTRLRYDVRSAKTYYQRYFTGDKLTQNDLVLVAIVGGEIVGVSGYGADYFSSSNACWLGWTVVDKEYSRNAELRVGSRLLEAVEEDLKMHKIQRLFVSTEDKNGPAINFYIKNGFEFEGRLRHYYYEGENMLILSKTLSR
jgi:ribosomal protein S18 acetylase RimI-like enzyme